MRIVSFDPSLLNWGYSIWEYRDSKIHLMDIGVIQVDPDKSIKPKSHQDLDRNERILKAILLLIQDTDILITEMPIGSKSASAMKSYTTVISFLACCKIQVKHFLPVSPRQVKLALTDNPEASKLEMINAAVLKFPNANWPRRGKMITLGTAEHIADSIGATLSQSNQLEKLLCQS